MATLVGYVFDTVDGAQQMLDLVQKLAEEQQIDGVEAALVAWPVNRTRPLAENLVSIPEPGALGAPFWGMLFGLIFFVPFFGMAVGSAMGALTGHYAAYGVDKDFIRQARERVPVGTSGLFLMTSDAMRHKVTDAVKKRGLKFDLFYTNLSYEQERQLQEDFGS